MSTITGTEPIASPTNETFRTAESRNSAVSWAAILAGAFVAAAVTLVLIALGSGLGLASVSPWANSGVSATSFSIMTGIGLIVTQWIAAGMGGYITGRLRTKWVNTHTHEVFFRDTAHGLLTWAVATVVGAMLLTTAASSIVRGGVSAAASATSTAAQGVAQSGVLDNLGYSADALLRGTKPDAQSNPQATRAEITRILANGVRTGTVPADDKTYMAAQIAQSTGISQADAQKRVDDAIAQGNAAAAKAKQVADDTRKAASALAIFTALSLLIGAFISCAAAAIGGSLRDERP
jgi:hypothetical protein